MVFYRTQFIKMNMKVKILKNIIAFKNLEETWKNLYGKMPSKAVFQSFEFNYYSWVYELNNDKNTLALVVIYNENILTAIFPFYIDKRKRLRFINDSHADFNDCLSCSQFDFNVILQKLKEQFSINSFNLINLKDDAEILRNFKSMFSFKKLIPSTEYSVLELEKGIFPENFFAYKSKQKTEFRRVIKKNKEKTHAIMSCNNFSFPSEKIELLREKMIALGIRNNSFLPHSQLKLIAKLYQNNKIILSVVKTQNTLNAISFIIKDANQYLIWIDMYDNSKMINVFNYISLVTLLSSDNKVCINFGIGAYGYKVSNFLPKIMHLSSLHIFTSKWQELIYNIESFIIHSLRSFYKRIR